MLNNEARVECLYTLVNSGRIIRDQWWSDLDGVEKVCLLLALVPEMRDHPSPRRCPASLMPVWMADLTVIIDDYCTCGEWPQIIRRYSYLAMRWSGLFTPDDWDFIDKEIRVMLVEEAMWYIDDEYDRFGTRYWCETAILGVKEGTVSLHRSGGADEFLSSSPERHSISQKEKYAFSILSTIYDTAYWAERKSMGDKELDHHGELIRYIQSIEIRSLSGCYTDRMVNPQVSQKLRRKVSDRIIYKILDIIEKRCNYLVGKLTVNV